MANLVFDFLHHYQTGERRASDPADAYQYDEGHVMEAVVPVAVTSCEIHYWVRGMDEAEAYVPTSITPNQDGSYTILGNIPNSYFETYGDLRVYIVVTDGTASITTYEGRIHICERSKPDDYVDDDPENEATRVLNEAREAAATATAAAETCEEVLESIPADYSQLSDDVDDLKDGLTELKSVTTSDEYAQVTGGDLIVHTSGQMFLWESSNPKQVALDTSQTFATYTIGCDVTEGETIKVNGYSINNNYLGVGIIFSSSNSDIPVWSWLNGLPVVDTSLYDVYGGNTSSSWSNFEYEVEVPQGAKRVWVKGTSEANAKIYKKKIALKAYSKSESDSLFVRKSAGNYEESIDDMRGKPTIIFDFDQTAYDNRAEILKNNGLTATFAVSTTSNADNKALVADGFDLSPYQGVLSGSYGTIAQRPTDYTDVSAWRIFIGNLVEKCEEFGIFNSIMYSPYGHKGGSAIDTVCKEFGFKYVRCGALYGADGTTVVEYVPVRTEPTVYHKYPVPMESLTVAQIKSSIDQTIEQNANELMLMCHAVDGGSGHMTVADFTEIVEYVKAKKDAGLINVLNMHQYYALWYPFASAEEDNIRAIRASMALS